MTTTEAAPAVTVVLPFCAKWVEAHREGCKAATRRVKRVDTEVLYSTTVEDILSMRANPDEGTVKVHACLRPWLAEF